jgi:hypothetical protein
MVDGEKLVSEADKWRETGDAIAFCGEAWHCGTCARDITSEL